MSNQLQEDLTLMSGWFEGEFDNFQQVWLEEEDSVSIDLRHEHIHSIFKKVEIPAIGEHVFFVKQYMDGDTTKVYRQRVYHFFVNKSEAVIQLDIYSFLTKEAEQKYGQAHQNPEMMKDLTKAHFKNLPGCAVYWKKQDDRFIGYMKEKACFFNARYKGKKVYITDNLKLTANEIWIRDEATDANGNYVFGNKAGVHHKLKKCRFFDGWLAVQKPDSEEYFLMRGISLHDQGKRVQLVDQDGTETKYFIELSTVIYRGGIEVLKQAIYEQGIKKARAYVWTNSEAKRIGINMRSMTAGFTFRE